MSFPTAVMYSAYAILMIKLLMGPFVNIAPIRLIIYLLDGRARSCALTQVLQVTAVGDISVQMYLCVRPSRETSAGERPMERSEARTTIQEIRFTWYSEKRRRGNLGDNESVLGCLLVLIH